MLRLPSLAVLVAFVAALIAVPPFGGSEGAAIPETLSHRAPVGSAPVQPGFPIDYVGVVWDLPEHAGEHARDHVHEHAEGSHGAVRFRYEGDWGPWIELIEDGADGPGHWASGLVPGGGADAYQVRGVPPDAGEPRAVALNTTSGPSTGATSQPAAHALDDVECFSREEWGADEDLRAEDDAFVFFDAQVTTVHHTATQNDDPEPAATVRAIYEYHTVDRGWDDIGYNYLIDEDGRVYEGRWSGADSQPCRDGGDGADFAHNEANQPVRGAHVGGYNTGNVGVALLGEFTTHPRWGADPQEAAIESLEDVLAHLMVRHGLDPEGTVDYVNPENEKDGVDTITGHSDWVSTQCPGERLYDRLPEIRAAVAGKVGDTDEAGDLSVNIVEPEDGAIVEPGEVTFTATASSPDGDDVTGDVAWYRDGDDEPFGTGGTVATTLEEGPHTITAEITHGDETATDTISVTAADESDEAMATVASIEQWGTGGRNSDQHLDVEVTIVDSHEGDPVADALVHVEIRDEADQIYATDSGTTGSDGVASYRFTRIPSGCYTTVVTAVDADLAWDGSSPDPVAFCKS